MFHYDFEILEIRFQTETITKTPWESAAAGEMSSMKANETEESSRVARVMKQFEPDNQESESARSARLSTVPGPSQPETRLRPPFLAEYSA